jgi:hypothetical protein
MSFRTGMTAVVLGLFAFWLGGRSGAVVCGGAAVVWYLCGETVFHGVALLVSPTSLFRFQRWFYDCDVYPVRLGSERYTVFSRDALSQYWKLMTYATVDALPHRVRVPHLNFPHIRMTDLEHKTKLSRSAIVDTIKAGGHNEIISTFVSNLFGTRDVFSSLSPSPLSLKSSENPFIQVADLQRFCFDLVSRPMMTWLLGSTVTDTYLSSAYYDSMYYYSVNFNPLYFFGMKLDVLMGMFPFAFKTLRRHQSVVETIFRDVYRRLGATSDALKTDSVLINRYMDAGLAEDDFVWLMNATLWAAIHYPSLVLYASLLTTFNASTSRHVTDMVKDVYRPRHVTDTVRDVFRHYSALMLPKVLRHDTTVALHNKLIHLKRGDVIAFSPLDYHLADKRRRLLPGSKGDWSCPAISFSIDWIATTITKLHDRYSITYDATTTTIPQVAYNVVLVHSSRKFPVTLHKKKHKSSS